MIFIGRQNRHSKNCRKCLHLCVCVCVCDVLECGTEAEEGWEMVQRTNKTKFRPLPINGSQSKTSVPARQADSDGRTVSQMRHKEGSCRSNVVASRQTRVAVNDVKKQQQCSVSAVDINGNSSNFTKSTANASQQSKSSSHISDSRGDRGTKSSPKVMSHPLPATRSCLEAVNSDKCLKIAEISVADTIRESGSSLGENSRTVQGDSKLNTETDESDLHSCVCISVAESHRSTEMQAGSSSKLSVGITNVTETQCSSSRTSSSMTEMRRSESADNQQSSSDSDRQSFHLCRKSVSDDTLVERMTASGEILTITALSVVRLPILRM